MEAVFLKLLNMSITAGWLILVVMILRLILKKAPKKISCILWAFVAIRLLCPFSLESVFSLIPSAETVPADIVYEQVPQIHSGIDAFNYMVNPILAESLAPVTETNSVNPIQIVIWIASRLWLVGVAAMVIYVVVSYQRLKRKVAVSVPLHDVMTEETLLFDQSHYAGKMDFEDAFSGSARYYHNIYLCDYIDTPFILGIFRPKIYLPSSLDFEKISSVIAHEEAHLKRHDHWWKPMGFLLLTIYWFNPIVWMAYLLLGRDIELACDEKVIRDMNESQKKAYSEALLSCSSTRRYVAACPLAFGEVGVKERIRAVLHYKKPAFWLIAAAIVICMITAICFLTDPEEHEAAAPTQSYIVDDIIYSAPQFNFTYTKETAPIFSISPMMELYILETPELGIWLSAGVFEEIELSAENFDPAFVIVDDISGFSEDKLSHEEQIQSLREENARAWKLNVVDENYGVVYHFLEQGNGDRYLIQGTYLDVKGDWSEVEKSREYGTNMMFRWVFKLVPGTLEDAAARAESASKEQPMAMETEAVEPETAVTEVTGLEAEGSFFPVCMEYVYSDGGEIAEPTIRFYPDDDTFTFTYSPLSSYLPYGKYEINGQQLTLKTDDGEYQYVFQMVDNMLIFDAGQSSQIPEYRISGDSSETKSPVPDGAVFRIKSVSEPSDRSQKISDNFDIMVSSTSMGVSYEDCITAHAETYEELIAYGYDTLQYCFSSFAQGDQTGLRGMVMAKVCDDILVKLNHGFKFSWESMGEEQTGQDWFDHLYTHLRLMRNGISAEYMEKDYPDSWKLLEMIEGNQEETKPTLPQGYYEVEEIRYSVDLEFVDRVIMDLPSRNFGMENAPLFEIDNKHYDVDVCENFPRALRLGEFSFDILGECLPVALTAENFDDCFKRKDDSVRAMIQEFKDNNLYAWKIGYIYNSWNQALLLVQEDGSIYMLLSTAYDGNGDRTGTMIFYDRVLKLKARRTLSSN